MAENDTIDPNRTLSCLLCPLICSASALIREGCDEKIHGVVYGFRGRFREDDEKLNA
jgi:hypothetical protein